MAKTETQVFLETAAGIWKAIGELAEVVSNYKTGLPREAHKAQQALQQMLDSAIKDWNESSYEQHARIGLCESQIRYVPWNTADKCEIYVVAHGNGGFCTECAKQREDTQAGSAPEATVEPADPASPERK
jgi:hypothetical protein